MINNVLDLTILFAASFFAATLIPAQSEGVLAVLQLTGNHNNMVLLGVATLGNVLGACINWLFGRYLLHFQYRNWFPINADKIASATKHYKRFGVWTLLFSWLPIIGDPLTLIAGIFQTKFWLFLFLVTIGKLSRYVIIMLVIM